MRQASASRAAGVLVRAERASWLPGAELPSYLNGAAFTPTSCIVACIACSGVKKDSLMPNVFTAGELPGDFGFDPLRLGENKEALQWYQQAELQNGRHVRPIPAPFCGLLSLQCFCR